MNTYVQKLVNWIAAGQSPEFTANASHVLLGALVTVLFPAHAYIGAVGITVYAAVKEFWFDAKFEKNPPQTVLDNVEDFVGYVLGSASGLLFLHFFH